MTLRTIQRRPVIIQGGMGVGISSWRAGQRRRPHRPARRRLRYRPRHRGGAPAAGRRPRRARPPGAARLPAARGRRSRPRPLLPPAGPRRRSPTPRSPRLGLRSSRAADELAVVGNFVEVWLAKEGHGGWIGINFLEKIQMATPAAAYGAMLAGVDCVLMGAGIPREIPQLLDELSPSTARHGSRGRRPATEPVPLTFDPALARRRPAAAAAPSDVPGDRLVARAGAVPQPRGDHPPGRVRRRGARAPAATTPRRAVS